jgi:hypothetical protein
MNIRLSKSALYNTTRMMVGTARATHTTSVLIYTHKSQKGATNGPYDLQLLAIEHRM